MAIPFLELAPDSGSPRLARDDAVSALDRQAGLRPPRDDAFLIVTDGVIPGAAKRRSGIQGTAPIFLDFRLRGNDDCDQSSVPL